MERARVKKIVIAIVAAMLLLVAYLLYSRPMTLSKLYPMLTLDKCTTISGYYKVGTQEELSEFTIKHDSEEFQKLCTLFYEQEYRRNLRDILPAGTRIHRTEPNDVQWEVYFTFQDVEYPDGSVGSGKLLHIQNRYGALSLHFDGETYSCHTSGQEAWAKEVLEIIR